MKIVIAPDSYKGSLSAAAVAEGIKRGIQNVLPDAEILCVPIADGGEGTVDCLVQGVGGRLETRLVTGPDGEKVNAAFGVLDSGTAVIEMAAASGLPLMQKSKLNPMTATTYGTGELIKAALDLGCGQIIIGIGGSATNDGGAGMAQALGVSFRDKGGKELGFGGGALAELAEIDLSGLDKRVSSTKITIAGDVTNPLCGETGASVIFGPQKGADAAMVAQLDTNLAHLAHKARDLTGLDFADVPGAGAAGGLGYGLMVFCGAQMRSGIETVLNALDLERHLPDCDLVITGEGNIDRQSAFGKVPVGVAACAKKYNVPVLAIAGGIGAGADAVYSCGVDSIISTVNRPMTLQDAIATCESLLEDAAQRAMRMILIGGKIAEKS